MKKLLKYLGDYKKECFLAPLFKLLEASAELIVPLIIAAIVDKGISSEVLAPDKPFIYRMCGILALLAFAGLIFAVIAQYYSAKAAVGFSKEVRSSLFKKIQSLSFTELDTLGNSTMITRMTSDVNQVQNAVNLVLRLFLRAPVIVFGAMIMAFTVDAKAAVVFVIIIPLLSVVVFGIMALTVPLYRRVQERLDRLLGITRENLNGVRVIRAFAQEETETKRFNGTNTELSAMQRFVGGLSALTNPLTFLLINLAVIALIHTGALRVQHGDLSQGEVIALYNYMSQILVELIKLANLIVTVTKGLAGASRIESVMEMCPSLDDGGNAPLPESAEVVFNKVSLAYKNSGADSLTDISLYAGNGDTIGIIGGTGSGKSSVVNLIPRFYDVTGGEILIGGRNIKEYPISALRSMIGIVPQYARLFKGTVRDNMKMGYPDASDDELISALKDAQAWEFVSSKPGVLDFMIEPSGRNLSGGQKQRLTIARALVRRPRILILDDSASALDYATDSALRKAISELDYHPTTFIVSQRASSVLGADKVLVLEDGESVGFDSPEKLLGSCETYQEIYYCQFPDEKPSENTNKEEH